MRGGGGEEPKRSLTQKQSRMQREDLASQQGIADPHGKYLSLGKNPESGWRGERQGMLEQKRDGADTSVFDNDVYSLRALQL